MISIALTEAALVAIAKTLPEGTVLHVDRRGWQSYSDLILRLAEIEAGRGF
jgi:hypothetical protein